MCQPASGSFVFHALDTPFYFIMSFIGIPSRMNPKYSLARRTDFAINNQLCQRRARQPDACRMSKIGRFRWPSIRGDPRSRLEAGIKTCDRIVTLISKLRVTPDHRNLASLSEHLHPQPCVQNCGN
jgi:hypothetical protein